ncbi:MAG: DUF309 domain-containing protein [Candidatus Delongbacteria bacterium]
MSTPTEQRRSLAARGLRQARRGHSFSAHEIWEELWLELSGDDRLWLQALIQLAVSQLHRESGNNSGALSLREKATVKLGRLAASDFHEPEWAAGLGLPLPCHLLVRLARPDGESRPDELWADAPPQGETS